MKIKNFSMTIFLKPRSYILISLIVLILAFLCNSCSTNANKGTISGTVILVNDTDNPSLNPVDYAGVTVALYKTAELDTTLVRINQQYPQIGVQITQETEFDHRNFNPLKVTTTDAVGKFSFPSLTPGDYNIVIWKNEWGIRYICSVKAIENENNNIGNIVLYPETIYNSAIVSETTIFKSDHSYFILTDVNFTSSVEFQPRAQIFINPACIVKFYGAVITPEFTSSKDMWKITSGKEIYSTSPVTMDFDNYYSSVNFYGDEINLKSGVIRYGSSGISTSNLSLNNISYIVFSDCGVALTINQGNLDVICMVISECNDTGVLYVSETSENANVNIMRSIIASVHQRGISVLKATKYNINNCYFYNNLDTAIRAKNCYGSITNNNFYMGYYHIMAGYSSNISESNEIHYNNFYDASINIRPTGNSNNINYNNFFSSKSYFIFILLDTSPYSTVLSDVNSINNYWLLEEVSQYLFDAEDDPRCPYHIIYLPRLSNPVKQAGIQ